MLETSGVYIAPQNWFLSYKQGKSPDLNKEDFQKQGMEALARLYPNAEVKNHLNEENPDLIENLAKSHLQYC